MNFTEAIGVGTTTTEEARAVFDALEPVTIEQFIGAWKGCEFPSGHAMDGSLADSGWFGKRLTDTETVDPLLFYTSDREGIFTADPIRKRQASARGVKDIAGVRAEVETDAPTARLRVEYRGIVTTAMIYDQLAIIDYFRRVDDDTLLGAIDRRVEPSPYFFVLRRHG